MNNVIIRFDEKKAFDKAKDYFIKICGFQQENRRHKNLYSLGMDYRIQSLDAVQIKAIISSYDADVFQSQKVVIEGIEFTCPAFKEIEKESVVKIFTYAITVGEFNFYDHDDIVEQVFVDIWGTAYTDSARDLLESYVEQYLEQEFPNRLGKTLFLSNAFGPGLYGMDVIQTKDMFKVLNAESIGMRVKDSGIMLPQKSCSGLYFALNSPVNLPHQSCRECQGSHLSCSFCRFRQERSE